MTLKQRAWALKRDIPAVYLALKSNKTPVAVKILAGVTLALALSPVDLIPDFIPVLGWLDDLLLLPGLIALTIKLIPGEVLSDCRRQSQEIWREGAPKKWYFALPAVAVWLAALWAAVKVLRR